MDVFSPAKRSEIMRRVRSKGTKPELAVRRLVAELGFHYRLNSKKLPGHPDLVFGRLHKVIFVHGCFWHGHSCKAADLPASNREYWEAKRLRNVERDKQTRRDLRRSGWKSLVVWECQASKDTTRNRVRKFLRGENV
ncbi:MAG TPA: very short patch repair endonuclease [Terriglobia bacterium]|nr:very short patch repair endonuclease [Terriglobia bacterium]